MRVGSVVAVCFCLSAGAAAQHPFRSGTEVVLVDVLVTDGRVAIAGLTAADFELRDNGVPQRIASVTMEEVPLSLTIATDSSASMAGERLQQLKTAARASIAVLTPQDWVAGVVLATIQLVADWTSDRVALAEAVESMTAGGGTAMNHALEFALGYRDAAQTRALALVFSDGMDSASFVWLAPPASSSPIGRTSWCTAFPSAIPRICVPSRPITVRAFQLLPPHPGPSLLDGIARATGGQVLRATKGSELKDAFLRVLKEFRSRSRPELFAAVDRRGLASRNRQLDPSTRCRDRSARLRCGESCPCQRGRPASRFRALERSLEPLNNLKLDSWRQVS